MNPHLALLPLTWAASELDEAIRILALKSGFLSAESVDKIISAQDQDSLTIAERITAATNQLGIESQTITIPYPEVSHFLRHGGPALLPLRIPPSPTPLGVQEPRFVALLKTSTVPWRVKIVAPDGLVHRVKSMRIRDAVCYDLVAPLEAEIEPILANLSEERRRSVRKSLLTEQLQDRKIDECVLLRLSPSTSLWRQAKQLNLPRHAVVSVVAQSIQYAFYLGAYALIGQAALRGRTDWALLLTAILVLVSGLPFSLAKVWSDRLISVNIGYILKRRLFTGILALDLDLVRQVGVGQFLAWTIESERLEEGILRGGLMSLGALVSLMTTAIALMLVGGALLGFLLLCWLVLTLFMGWRLLRSYMTLNEHYSEMTLDFLSRIQGHETRLIQEKNWHGEQDQALTDYLRLLEKYNKNLTRLMVLMPSGWLIVGLLGISYNFILQPDAFATLGTSLIALLLSFTQFEIIAFAAMDVVKAVAAWYLISPIVQAAPESPASVALREETSVSEASEAILKAQDLFFRYQTGQRPVLAGCNLEIYAQDRILLEGPSGGGKSTLAAVLIGLRQAQSGLLLLSGLDQYSIGAKVWRQRVVAAPQFHENHILNASFAFNLLMGRQWPPTAQDLAEAEEVCRECGLGTLLDKMPQGLEQMVGEEGWRLSHGERSRLYIARALLQNASLIILDESFASLDPENMEITLRTVLARAPALLVIAHP